jgi:hypothetical protein
MSEESPSVGSMEFGSVHAAAIDAMKLQLLIVLVNRLGGKVEIPVQEIDATGQYLLGMHLVTREITGDKTTDARLTGVFHFEVRKKQ